jgi:hypothetical protein
MTRAIEQIERDLTQLTEKSLLLGTEIEQVYQKYLAVLAPAIKKQAIQACYYLCTNDYPEAFLQLSYSQREQLLKSFQRVINHAIRDLDHKLSPLSGDEQPSATSTLEIAADRFRTPETLYFWQKDLDQAIHQTTQIISQKINLLLQQSHILPTALPKAILEATTKAGDRGENLTDVPNILSMLVEEEEDDGEDESDRDRIHPAMMKLDILYLRLTDIEFIDMVVMSWRKQINQLVGKIAHLRREYRNKQTELKIAEAESAWRNSWFDS